MRSWHPCPVEGCTREASHEGDHLAKNGHQWPRNPRPRGLTVDDLRGTLADERHLGFGYACCDDLPRRTLDRLDRAVVGVANELGLDREGLFHWSNSKYGRWLYDAVYGNDKPPTRATVRTLLNDEAMRLATEGVT